MIRCPLCGVVIPEEDRDIVNPIGENLVAQILCRSCQKAFTICEEKSLMRIQWDNKSKHPEDLR